jgi:tetratricopeptide (TPR) repeat protein
MYFKPHARTGALISALLTLGLFLISCASGPRGGRPSDLNRAIESFIAGDYQDAAERLEAMTKGAGPDEDLGEVYLYLGRSYIALEQYSQAIDAFTTGKANGGGPVFDEYLRRMDLLVSGAPSVVATSIHMTRGQLAAVIDRMFYEASADAGASSAGVVTSLQSVQRGIVPVLPDGAFHEEALVTRAALYAALARLLGDKGAGVPAVQGLFEGGYAWVLSGADETEASYVSGREAIAALERVSLALESHGG